MSIKKVKTFILQISLLLIEEGIFLDEFVFNFMPIKL